MEDNLIETISSVQKYVENNLDKSITLYELAKIANYSIPQFERLFKQAVGVSPLVYVKRLRLTAAAKSLRDNDIKVIDTALNFLFDSHEGFTRAFSKQFGISPFRYKKNPTPIKYFISYDVIAKKSFNNFKEKEIMKTVTVFTQIVERPLRKAIIKRGVTAKDYFAYCEEVGCDVWGLLCSVKEALFEPSGYWLPKAMITKGTSEYVQGVEVPFEYSGAIPEGFEVITLPKSSFMVFNGEEFDDANFMEEIGAVWEAIEKYKPQTYGYEWDLSQPRFQLEPRGERGYIEARPVKAIK